VSNLSIEQILENQGIKIVKLIGTGMCDVYEATWNGRKVAVKVPRIDPKKTLKKEELEPLLREIEVWKGWNHPNIVKIYQTREKPIPHIIMEYCQKSLRDLIQKGPIPSEKTIKIITKILDALEYAHHYGVVHRDIKPENILICNDEPKLTDWGIAKIMIKTTTKTGQYMTMQYAAPEQIDKKKFGEIDWRTDIWQIGCLLYEMLTGEPPFQAENPLELAIKITTEIPKKPEKIPQNLWEIIEKCLSKNKEKRWQTTTELKIALQKTTRTFSFTISKMPRITISHMFTFTGHKDEVLSVCWSPDGRYIASGSEDSTVRIWDIFTGKLSKKLFEHPYGTHNCVSWSPDGKYLASGNSYKTVMVWEVTTGDLVRTLKGHEWDVNSVCWSPDGKYLASGSFDGTFRIWDASTGKLLKTFVIYEKDLKLFTVNPITEYPIGTEDFDVTCITWSPNGKYIACGLGEDCTIRICDVSAGRQIKIFKHYTYTCSSDVVAWSPDGKYIANTCEDGIVIWYFPTEKILKTLKGDFECVCWSPGGKYLVSGSRDGEIYIWDVFAGEVVKAFKGHEGDVLSVAWSPGGKYIVSGSSDSNIRVWEVNVFL